MPRLDKPLNDLLLYQGRNPRPADFDAYWDAGLRELDATAPQPELVRNAAIDTAHSEAFDLWFTGVGGARLYAKYLRPKNRAVDGGANSKSPALLQFHGYTGDLYIGSSGDFTPQLSFSGEGFCVAALDVRGQAGRSEDPSREQGTSWQGHFIRGLDASDPRELFYRQVFLDTAQLARVVMSFDEVDAERVGVLGNSQGGALALACAALEPRIRRAVIGKPFLCDYRRVWEMDLANGNAYWELSYFFKNFDPRHEHEEAIFTRLGYIDCQHLAPRIRAEVLLFTALMDAYCPPSSQFAAYNKITSKKDLLVYPEFGHLEPLPDQMDKTFAFFQNL